MSNKQPAIRTIRRDELPAIVAQANAEQWTHLALLRQKYGFHDLYAQELLGKNWPAATIFFVADTLYAPDVQVLAALTHLHTLDVRYHDIGAAGVKALATLTQLHTLAVRNNNIGSAGAKALATLTQLRTLHVSGNDIGAAGAKALATLTQLQSLDVSVNRIGDAGAKALATLTQLHTLHVGYNDIGAAGAKALATLKQLHTLHVGFNDIGDDGAKALATLTQLHTLDVGDNRIGDQGLRDLLRLLNREPQAKNLRLLRLDQNNKQTTLPAELFSSDDAQAILAVFRRYEGPGERPPLNEAKLIFVGNEDVGKTTLIEYLVDKKPRDPNHTRTPRANVYEPIETKDWTPEGCPVKVHIWDFGGQRIMRGAHRYFLTQRSLYVLVLTARREDDRSIYEWLQTIRSLGGDSPVIVVLNKYDLCGSGADWYGSIQRTDYPNIVAFLRTTCNDDDASRASIQTLREQIVTSLFNDERLKHIRQPIPKAYLQIKEAIANKAKQAQVLDYDEFVTMCATANTDRAECVTEPAEQRGLLRLLHDSGVVVAHGMTRDATMATAHVTLLDPNWLTMAIYAILMHETVITQQGVFTRSQLAEFLHTQDYPAARYDVILGMMKHPDIGLIFQLPGHEEKYLLPARLPHKQPDYSMLKPNLRFRFAYTHLPVSVLHHLIVQAHQLLSETETRWYSGALFSVEACSVLVQSNEEQRWIDITITGDRPRCRSALAVIVLQLETVHWQNYIEMTPEKLVPHPDDENVIAAYDDLVNMEAQEGGDFEFYPKGSRRKYRVRDFLDAVRLPPNPPPPPSPTTSPLKAIVGPLIVAGVCAVLLAMHLFHFDRDWFAIFAVFAFAFGAVYVVQAWLDANKRYWARKMATTCVTVAAGLLALPGLRYVLKVPDGSGLEFIMDNSPWGGLAFVVLAGVCAVLEYRRERAKLTNGPA